MFCLFGCYTRYNGSGVDSNCRMHRGINHVVPQLWHFCALVVHWCPQIAGTRNLKGTRDLKTETACFCSKSWLSKDWYRVFFTVGFQVFIIWIEAQLESSWHSDRAYRTPFKVRGAESRCTYHAKDWKNSAGFQVSIRGRFCCKTDILCFIGKIDNEPPKAGNDPPVMVTMLLRWFIGLG